MSADTIIPAHTVVPTPPAAPVPAALAAAGWELGPPDLPGIPEAVAIDAEVASHARCGRCRRKGLGFVPTHKTGPCGSIYGGFYCCTRCGWTEEA